MTDQDNSGLSVISFPGTGNLTHFAATENGYYSDEGLAVELTPTPNSVYQITNTVAGEFNIASTAIDNIVAYQEELMRHGIHTVVMHERVLHAMQRV